MMERFILTSALVAAGLAIGLAAGTTIAGGCGVGNVTEIEACGDDSNGGCNAAVPVFEDIVCGDSVSGTAWADGSRDTDWYFISLPDPDGDGQATLSASLFSEFPGVVFIIDDVDTCDAPAVVASGFSAAGCAGGDAAVACLPAPANYVVFVSVGNPDGSAIFEGYPCANGQNGYRVTTTCSQVGDNGNLCDPINPLCIGAAGSCGEANGSPGCDDPGCCTLVCDFDAFCCETEWDETCVEGAVNLCGIFVYTCNSGANPPVNDCCSSPMLVSAGDIVAFDTTNAETDGPDAECGSGSGDLQVHKDVWYMIQAPGNGRLVSSTCGDANFDTKIAAYDAGDGNFECTQLLSAFLACNEDCAADDVASELSLDVVEGNFYLIRLGGFLGESGTGNISFTFKNVLWDTGPNRALIFNGASTNLGWSSGNVAAGLEQRWSAQAFTLAAPPAGFDGWNVCQINPNGFVPAGLVNDTIDFIIWSRNGLAAPVDGDQVATGSVPFPVAVEDPDGTAGNLWRHPMTVDVDLPAGDYWLTVYGANTQGVPSNFAWFANPDFGINVLDGSGNPFMWRSATFPSPGFVAYTTPAVVQAAGLDPNDVYNASFEVLGTPANLKVGCPCVWDLTGDCVVGPADLASLLAAWNAPYGPADLAALLAEWNCTD